MKEARGRAERERRVEERGEREREHCPRAAQEPCHKWKVEGSVSKKVCLTPVKVGRVFYVGACGRRELFHYNVPEGEKEKVTHANKLECCRLFQSCMALQLSCLEEVYPPGWEVGNRIESIRERGERR